MADVSGHTKGYEFTRRYDGLGHGTPLLGEFAFTYNYRNSSDRHDNHLLAIEVLPGGQSEDLTPTADLSPASVPEGEVELLFRDADPTSPEDEYDYFINHYVFDNTPRYQIRDVGCRGECDRVLPSSVRDQIFGPLARHSFALCGFKLFYIGNEDHHVARIAVHEEEGHLITSLSDAPQNTFGYLVDFAIVPGTPNSIISTVNQTTFGETSGSGFGYDHKQVRADPNRSIIRGFDFRLTGTERDMHIRDIQIVFGVEEGLSVAFADAVPSPSEQFDWMVKWASIGPQEVVGVFDA
jgi:hypothetical protein